MTNAHFDEYQPGGAINVSGGKKFRETIAPLFGRPKDRGVETALRRA